MRELVRFESNHNTTIENAFDLFALAPDGLSADAASKLADEVVDRTKKAEQLYDAGQKVDFQDGDFSGELQKRAEAAGFQWIGNCSITVNQGD